MSYPWCLHVLTGCGRDSQQVFFKGVYRIVLLLNPLFRIGKTDKRTHQGHPAQTADGIKGGHGGGPQFRGQAHGRDNGEFKG